MSCWMKSWIEQTFLFIMFSIIFKVLAATTLNFCYIYLAKWCSIFKMQRTEYPFERFGRKKLWTNYENILLLITTIEKKEQGLQTDLFEGISLAVWAIFWEQYECKFPSNIGAFWKGLSGFCIPIHHSELDLGLSLSSLSETRGYVFRLQINQYFRMRKEFNFWITRKLFHIIFWITICFSCVEYQELRHADLPSSLWGWNKVWSQKNIFWRRTIFIDL